MNIITLESNLCQNKKKKKGVASWLANLSSVGWLLTALWYMNQEPECHLLTYWEKYFWHESPFACCKKMFLYISTSSAMRPINKSGSQVLYAYLCINMAVKNTWFLKINPNEPKHNQLTGIAWKSGHVYECRPMNFTMGQGS